MITKFEQVKVEIDSYLNSNLKWQELAINYLDSPENVSNNRSLLIAEIDEKNIMNDNYLFGEFVYFLSMISTHHFRSPGFFNRLIEIIKIFKAELLQRYTNEQRFHLFKRCPPIILALKDMHILEFDEEVNCIISHNQYLNSFYYPGCESIEKIREKQALGENESYLCQLIREDKVPDFANEIATRGLPLDSVIDNSIFETHTLFKYKNDITLIQYAALCGSIRIFEYLLNSQNSPVVLDESLWPFALYGQNSSIINYLLDNSIPIGPKTYGECLIHATLCHHNSTIEWLQGTFTIDPEPQKSDEVPEFFLDPILKASIQSHNFVIMQHYLKELKIKDIFCEETLNELFYDCCKADLYFISKILLQIQEIDLNEASPFDPFQNACRAGLYNIVELVLSTQAEAQKNHTNKRFNLNNQSFAVIRKNSDIPDGLTAFELAVKNLQFTVVKKLLTVDKIKFDQISRWKGNTALEIASRDGYTLMVKILLDSGKEIGINHRNHAEYQLEKMQLIPKGGGMTALLLAVQNNHKDIVKLLLDHGADKSIKNLLEKTALETAQSSDIDPEIKTLLE